MNWIDFIVIALYFGLIFSISFIFRDKTNKSSDYFLGSKSIPWKVAAFSIVAVETSALTFISIPGLAYLTNMNFLQITFGYLLGRIFAAKILLPKYFAGEVSTAYSFLEKRFGLKTRRFASVIFVVTRIAADGVRLFATAIPLKLLLNIDYVYAICIVAVAALIYVYAGGIKSVIYIDALQFFVYIGGALFSVFYLINLLSTQAFYNDLFYRKLSVINFGLTGSWQDFFKEPYTLLSGLLGGAFLSMASHGADQLIVQRLLAAKDPKKASKALIASGVFVIFQFALFLFLGVLLYLYYGIVNMKSDEIFPYFIINEIPTGIKGLIISGLFAAALSTIAGSIISLSSSTALDIGPLLFRDKFDKYSNNIFYVRLTTIFWTIIIILSSLLFLNADKTAVELALSFASFTYGGLLGVFLLGLVNRKSSQEDALAGFTASIFGMIAVVILKLTAWTWFTLIGVLICLTIGSFLSRITTYNENTK